MGALMGSNPKEAGEGRSKLSPVVRGGNEWHLEEERDGEGIEAIEKRSSSVGFDVGVPGGVLLT